MPRQFTPADRDTVKEKATSMAKGGDVFDFGPGIGFVLDGRPFTTLHGLTQSEGWTVEAIYENHDENKVAVFLMPITEVPDA